jgi:hypothetical protein
MKKNKEKTGTENNPVTVIADLDDAGHPKPESVVTGQQATTGNGNDGNQEHKSESGIKETSKIVSETANSGSGMEVDSRKQSDTSNSPTRNVENNPQKSELGGTFQGTGLSLQEFIRMKNAQNTPKGLPKRQEYPEERITFKNNEDVTHHGQFVFENYSSSYIPEIPPLVPPKPKNPKPLVLREGASIIAAPTEIESYITEVLNDKKKRRRENKESEKEK